MPTQPLGPTGLLAQSMTLPAGSQSMAMGGMAMRAQGMDGRKQSTGLAGRYLIVGGGGGSETTASGGGGAGEFLEGQIVLASGIHAITVGAGGAWTPPSTNGAPSQAFGFSARGGGAGKRYANGVTGGSSGGGGSDGGNFTSPPPTGQNTNIGGTGAFSSGVYASGGGGGGAGGAGTNGTPSNGGNGGAGKLSDIAGTAQYYAAGGRGGVIFSSLGSNGIGWATNNGSGGDSDLVVNAPTGVVIWSYASPTQLCTGGTVTSYLNGSTRWWVHTFTSNGTLVVP